MRRHQDVAFRAAYLISRDAAEAEDACQDAFVKAWSHLHRFDPDWSERDPAKPGRHDPARVTERGDPADSQADAPFRPWLLRIVVNEARNRRVAAGRRLNLALRAGAGAAGPGPATGPVSPLGASGDAASSPEAAALADERRRELLAAVNALREEDRAVIACRYFLDLSEAETATALGLRRGTVKSRLSRALARARALLTDDSDEPGRRGADG